jgi:carbon-monoxide dehydrogenase large subunit
VAPTLEQREAIDVPAFRARQKQERAKGRHLGIGFATFSERTGYGSPAFAARGMDIVPGWDTVVLSVDPSGYVEARIGSSPHGQGLRTTLAQIIADEIGVTPDVIKVTHGDTDRSPYGWGTFGSRSLVISGGATMIAARKVRAKLLTIASHMLEAAPGDIVLENGTAKVAGTDRSVPIAKMAREAYTQTHRFMGEIEPGLTETGSYDPPGTFSNACHVAIVEVDVETGRVTVEKFLVAEDAGRIINPMIAEGQVHGGIAQGIGNALLEEIVYDESGGILTANLADYMPPTAREMPPIELHHRETPSTTSITEAKGLGEGGSIGAPAAVINAINDALTPFNVQIDEMPATPQRIRAALRAAPLPPRALARGGEGSGVGGKK